jgi:hypothetical protein
VCSFRTLAAKESHRNITGGGCNQGRGFEGAGGTELIHEVAFAGLVSGPVEPNEMLAYLSSSSEIALLNTPIDTGHMSYRAAWDSESWSRRGQEIAGSVESAS